MNAATKAEADLIHALLFKRFGQRYADIWKIDVNLSLCLFDLRYAN
jgi:hypothetical protein